MAGFFCLLLLFIADLLFDTAVCPFSILSPGLASKLAWLWRSFLLLSMIVVLALWITMIGAALIGSAWQVPFLKRLTHRSWVIRFSFFANSLLLALVPLAAVLALYATSMTRRSSEGAAVYFLYDEGIPCPRWAYALGIWRISLQAEENWGKGCTVLDRLTKETLRTALASGKVVILATHGTQGFILTTAPERLAIGPGKVGSLDEGGNSRFLRTSVLAANYTLGKPEDVPVSSNLQLAYVFGCYAGIHPGAWEGRLAPTKVITYNRLSSVFWDHALWFAFTGPTQLKGLK